MTVLTVKTAWTEPGYTPASLYEAPFVDGFCEPRFNDVLAAVGRGASLAKCSLEAFAAALVAELDRQIAEIDGQVHVLLSGGYDSRILTFLLERQGKQPLCITDGQEEPAFSHAVEVLGIPPERIYVHDLDEPDPYGLADATCDGFAPLYTQLRFMPADPDATLVSGLGGGEWFSYPASGWLRGKKRRLPGDDVVGMWMDCWPQYTLIPAAWARGYRAALHPYCTPGYASIAATCRPEWLRETAGNPALDLVREAMLMHLDERLIDPGWAPHLYEWRLEQEQRDRIDERYLASWVGRTYHRDEWGLPSEMDAADHACTLAGFASWCETLAANGAELRAEAA